MTAASPDRQGWLPLITAQRAFERVEREGGTAPALAANLGERGVIPEMAGLAASGNRGQGNEAPVVASTGGASLRHGQAKRIRKPANGASYYGLPRSPSRKTLAFLVSVQSPKPGSGVEENVNGIRNMEAQRSTASDLHSNSHMGRHMLGIGPPTRPCEGVIIDIWDSETKIRLPAGADLTRCGCRNRGAKQSC